MKKKLLPLAMLAGLAGVAGTAQAAHVNPDGLGEVLLYPYYTVENGQDTLVTIVNTTNQVKAVKVRFLESMNSAEVLDFNLYLSPHDHWSGVVTADPAGDGALIKTFDQSCTVPSLKDKPAGEKFRNLLFANGTSKNQNADGGPEGFERTREGYIEVIEMGVLVDTADFAPATAATHVNGVPANCALLSAAWKEQPLGSGTVVGEWADPTVALAAWTEYETGGLYGYAILMNTAEGTSAIYDAVAVDDFAAAVLHARPGDTAPNLGSGAPLADIIEGNQVFNLVFADGLDAMSAILMHDSISNDYVTEPALAAGTDWVITMPTKREYVNVTDPLTDPATLPFLNVWNAPGAACEEVQITYWDREERQPGVEEVPGGVDFSPSPIPEGVIVEGFALCGEANVISFLNPSVDPDDEDLVGYSSALYPSERVQSGFSVGFNNGWARLTMATDNSGLSTGERTLTAATTEVLRGLPVIGFAVQKYANSTIEGVGDAGAYYNGVVAHKTTRDIETP